VELLAVSKGVAVAYGIGLWAMLILAPMTITALKGQWVLFAAGWLTIGIVWWIAALRLARPGSWWDRHLYGPHKRHRGRCRYPANPPDEVAESGG
jgi:hypothetical protein